MTPCDTSGAFWAAVGFRSAKKHFVVEVSAVVAPLKRFWAPFWTPLNVEGSIRSEFILVFDAVVKTRKHPGEEPTTTIRVHGKVAAEQ